MVVITGGKGVKKGCWTHEGELWLGRFWAQEGELYIKGAGHMRESNGKGMQGTEGTGVDKGCSAQEGVLWIMVLGTEGRAMDKRVQGTGERDVNKGVLGTGAREL